VQLHLGEAAGERQQHAVHIQPTARLYSSLEAAGSA
jgi:hypothetical protein